MQPIFKSHFDSEKQVKKSLLLPNETEPADALLLGIHKSCMMLSTMYQTPDSVVLTVPFWYTMSQLVELYEPLASKPP